MSSILDKNFEEVTDKALRTGEKIITIGCPCCGKTFYVTEDEASFSIKDPATNPASLSYIKLGRKCPFCGFSGGYNSSVSSTQDMAKEYVEVETKAEEMAQEAAEKRQASWAQICGQGVKFDD